MLVRFYLPAWSSVHAWLLRLRTGSEFAPARVGVLWPIPAWGSGVMSDLVCIFTCFAPVQNLPDFDFVHFRL